MINKYKLKNKYEIKTMYLSPYPFVIDLKKKIIYILESITCCAIASQNNIIISEENFKEILGGK